MLDPGTDIYLVKKDDGFIQYSGSSMYAVAGVRPDGKWALVALSKNADTVDWDIPLLAGKGSVTFDLCRANQSVKYQCSGTVTFTDGKASVPIAANEEISLLAETATERCIRCPTTERPPRARRHPPRPRQRAQQELPPHAPSSLPASPRPQASAHPTMSPSARTQCFSPHSVMAQPPPSPQEAAVPHNIYTSMGTHGAAPPGPRSP